jgi:stress-induced morphogen
MRDRDQIKQILLDAFRKQFPHDTVDISDGYMENIHVMIVSRKFDTMSEPQKHDMMWTIIDGTDLNDEEKQLVSLLYPLSPAESK